MLVKRVVSATIAVAFLAILLWWGGLLFNLFLILVSLIGMSELYRAFSNKGVHSQRVAGYLVTILFYVQHFMFHGSYDFLYLLITIVLLLSIQVFIHTVQPGDVAVTILGVLYPGILLAVASLMKEAAFVHPNYLLIMTLTATYSTDTFAYFTGKSLGKRKLCSAISPNKTVEGSLGGMTGSVILVSLLGIILNWVYNTQINPIHFVVIGLLGGVFSQIGDLTASSFKRYCEVKDFGNIMPGHGGMLDRIDSLLFVLPVIYVYSQLFLMG